MVGSSKAKYGELACKSVAVEECLGFLMIYDYAKVRSKSSACADFLQVRYG
jgi:hypothetical protein